MANRQEVHQKRRRLNADLRAACRDGILAVGDLVPSQAELSRDYDLSPTVVHNELRKLINEGLLYTVPRGGTFVGQPISENVDVFLLILLWPVHADGFTSQVQMGFEERIAQKGGVSLMLTYQEAVELHAKKELPPIKGVFEMEISPLSREFEKAGIPCVTFGSSKDEKVEADIIRFDNRDGGAQATRYLMAAGHRRIAFLGLNTPEDEEDTWSWSVEREAGWHQVISAASGDVDLVFRPSSPVKSPPGGGGLEGQVNAAREAASRLVHRTDIDAIVVANFFALQGLLEALKIADVPPERWPAIIGFDETPMMSGAIVSYLRLPWELVGRKAAEMLYDRATGKVKGSAQQQLIRMRLIPRFSCREQWTKMPGVVRRLTTRSISTAAPQPSLHRTTTNP